MAATPEDWLEALRASERLPASYSGVVASICRPLAASIAREAETRGRPVVIGICGAQGSGKSTLAMALQALLSREHALEAAILSLDDLYLPLADRVRLARDIHPLFRTRGPPGTHDIALGLDVLDAALAGRPVALPRFDKALDERKTRRDWPMSNEARVILFEGWCVGARPQAAERLTAPVNELEQYDDRNGVWRTAVNAHLSGAYQTLFVRLDRLVLLAAPSFEVVLHWRLEQEHKLRAKLAATGAPGRAMSDPEIRRFIQHYERLTRHILGEMPGRADVHVPLGASRAPLNALSESAASRD